MSIRLSAALDNIVARLPERAATYFFLFACWFIILWLLSSGNPSFKSAAEIPYLDKLAHFIYFYIGGALLTIASGLKWHGLSRMRLFLTVVIICSVIGRLDEYHQSYVPGRTGNDNGDWFADTVGGLSGCTTVLGCLLSRFRIKNGC
ncbi:MAG: VanZ family protein [Akkermansiaceae bacterium]